MAGGKFYAISTAAGASDADPAAARPAAQIAVRKLGPIPKRWDSQHIPMIVEEADYLEVVVERGLLQVAAGMTDRPKDLTEVASGQEGAAAIPTRPKMRQLIPRLTVVGALAGLAWLKLRPHR